MRNSVIIILIIFSFSNLHCKTNKLSDKVQPNILLINIDDLGWRDVGFIAYAGLSAPSRLFLTDPSCAGLN